MSGSVFGGITWSFKNALSFQRFVAFAAVFSAVFCIFAGMLDSFAAENSAEYASPYAELHEELYVERSAITEYANDDNCIYLTFDDGPSPYTEELLEVLDMHGIKATFFLSPEDTEYDFRMMKLIAEKGHTIGIHTASHVFYEIYADVESYLDDFALAYELVYRATGQKCKFFRFPGGSVNSYNYRIKDQLVDEMSRRGFVFFDWNVDSRDAAGASLEQIRANVFNQTPNVSPAFILMHDGIKNTTLILNDIINALEADARGYSFRVITEEVRPLQF